jgi:hypothetical protein
MVLDDQEAELEIKEEEEEEEEVPVPSPTHCPLIECSAPHCLNAKGKGSGMMFCANCKFICGLNMPYCSHKCQHMHWFWEHCQVCAKTNCYL